MSAKILDGKVVSAEIKANIKREVEKLSARGITPGLATILVGENPASQIYVRNKHKDCQEAGFISCDITLPADTPETSLLAKINELNHDGKVHGILVQLPLPAQINTDKVLAAISPEKDADGFHPMNMGRLLAAKDFRAIEESTIPIPIPCTPRGCMEFIKRTGVPVSGLNAVVLGRSTIVGKPMAILLLGHHATVTIAHSRTKNLQALCREADILVAAIGKPRMVSADMVKAGAIVIDVGINRNADGTISGDVDWNTVKEKAGWITPVPGGVGLMTRAMLLMNTLMLAKCRGNS